MVLGSSLGLEYYRQAQVLEEKTEKIWWHLDAEKAAQSNVTVLKSSKELQMTMAKAYSDLPIELASALTVPGCFAEFKGSTHNVDWQMTELQTLFSAAFAPENIE